MERFRSWLTGRALGILDSIQAHEPLVAATTKYTLHLGRSRSGTSAFHQATLGEHPHGLSDAVYDSLFANDTDIVFGLHGYRWLVHRLTYRRSDRNLHVRGYTEEGTITTAFDMRVQNDLDRFHLVQDVIDRLPHLGSKGAYLTQAIQDQLIAHRHYIDKYGRDLPEIRIWKWSWGGVPEGNPSVDNTRVPEPKGRWILGEEARMPIQLKEEDGGKFLVVHISARLAKEDYERFVPEFERLVRQHGKLRLLFEMTDFHGWDAGALWEDIKFDMKHFNDIDRLAMVGETKWQQGMATFCKPFTTATIRYFDHASAAEARKWLGEM